MSIKLKHRKALTRALLEKGILLGEMTRRSKHSSAVVSAEGRTAIITLPLSPSCSRWVQNCVRDARHALSLAH